MSAHTTPITTSLKADVEPTLSGYGDEQPRTPSPMLTDYSSAPATSNGADAPNTPLTSEVSYHSLSTVKDAPPPPTTKWPYTPSDALEDIPGVAHALDLFLKSKMVESEDFCHSNDPNE